MCVCSSWGIILAYSSVVAGVYSRTHAHLYIEFPLLEYYSISMARNVIGLNKNGPQADNESVPGSSVPRPLRIFGDDPPLSTTTDRDWRASLEHSARAFRSGVSYSSAITPTQYKISIPVPSRRMTEGPATSTSYGPYIQEPYSSVV